MVTKGIIFLDALGLFCKAILRIENFISVKISLAKLWGSLILKAELRTVTSLIQMIL